MKELIVADDVIQIDCNNPNIDSAVLARFGSVEASLVVTSAGLELTADHTDEVPYACPLTRATENLGRLVENFVMVCKDCPHSYISY